MEVPGPDYQESVESQLRIALAEATRDIDKLQDELGRVRAQLNRERLERDHWFEAALDLRKIALNLSEHLE